jgi:hypothetical protein
MSIESEHISLFDLQIHGIICIPIHHLLYFMQIVLPFPYEITENYLVINFNTCTIIIAECT